MYGTGNMKNTNVTLVLEKKKISSYICTGKNTGNEMSKDLPKRQSETEKRKMSGNLVLSMGGLTANGHKGSVLGNRKIPQLNCDAISLVL